MFKCLKGMFRNNREMPQADQGENNQGGNYTSLAKLEHVEFIVGEILKGSATGNYNRSYAIAPEMLLPGLRKQVRESIQHNYHSVSDEEVVTSIISIGYINNEVSGFCWSTKPLAKTFELHMLSVGEGKRNMGLGKALLQDALASFPEGSQVIARIYKDEFKTDHSRSMLNILAEEGFTEPAEQPNTKTTLFSKELP